MQKQNKRHFNILAFTLLRSINSLRKFNANCYNLKVKFLLYKNEQQKRWHLHKIGAFSFKLTPIITVQTF